MAIKSNASIQTGFVDLATFSELEAFLYGGCEAASYFLRAINKSNWFTILPGCLKHVSGTPQFDSQFSAVISRSGDYALNSWTRALVPLVAIPNADIIAQPGFVPGVDNPPALRWTRNFMHYLFSRISITFNDLCVAELDSNWLDFNSNFRLPESKKVGYDNMIGDIPRMTNWVQMGVGAQADQLALGTGGAFSLPIPFWYAENSGVALPASALPFNDIKINYETRGWQQLLVMDPGSAGGVGVRGILTKNNVQQAIRAGANLTFQGPPSLANNIESWAEYAIVHNDERVKIGKAPRDMLITQVQRAAGFTGTAFNTAAAAINSVDLRFSHSIVALFWGAENVSNEGAHGNYTTAPFFSTSHPNGGDDPISHSTLIYESTNRVDMESDYYSLINPYYRSTRIPTETGYHMLSYSLHAWDYDPLGSTNYSKLNTVTLASHASVAATAAAAGLGENQAVGGGGDYTVNIVPTPSGLQPINGNALIGGVAQGQTFTNRIRALNWIIGRASGGSFGLPIL